MAKIREIILLFLVLLNFNLIAQEISVGAEKTDKYLPILLNKRVGIIANQTSVIKDTHLVDSLIKLDINIKKVFSPEHGFRGKKDAGERFDNKIDEKTGLPIISLYGENKKPSKKQLKNIDILVFDIQDVGVRFYTYISTLHYVMEAAAEEDIPLILLDRTNPNRHYIDGPILEKEYKSFVGMHPVPIVYGMTIGEYAKMINGEKWINKRCDLTIIPIDNYKNNIKHILKIAPSPNLPNAKSINLYPSLCLFEGTNMSVGRGTEYPFQHFGSPNQESLYSFIPKSTEGSKNPKHKDTECFGVDLRSYPYYLSSINLEWVIKSYIKSNNKSNFFNPFFDTLTGTDQIRNQIINGKTSEEIKRNWQEGISKFMEIRNKYLIYKDFNTLPG